jgi:hypothetical protein
MESSVTDGWGIVKVGIEPIVGGGFFGKSESMDQRFASLLFLGGVLLVMLGIYSSASSGLEMMARSAVFPWSKDVGMQVFGVVFTILGTFGLLRGSDTGEEF